MEAPLEKKTGTTFGPQGVNTKLIYFLDDLNLPEVDVYNTQSAIAIARQHIDYGHWYDPRCVTPSPGIYTGVPLVICLYDNVN